MRKSLLFPPMKQAGPSCRARKRLAIPKDRPSFPRMQPNENGRHARITAALLQAGRAHVFTRTALTSGYYPRWLRPDGSSPASQTLNPETRQLRPLTRALHLPPRPLLLAVDPQAEAKTLVERLRAPA